MVEHRARPYGQSKFGLNRFTNGLLDLLTVGFIARFGRKPMHFFGLLGLLMFVVSTGLFLGIGGYKLWALSQGVEAKFGVVELVLRRVDWDDFGCSIFLSGFLAEMISRNDPNRTNYRVSQRLS